MLLQVLLKPVWSIIKRYTLHSWPEDDALRGRGAAGSTRKVTEGRRLLMGDGCLDSALQSFQII